MQCDVLHAVAYDAMDAVLIRQAHVPGFSLSVGEQAELGEDPVTNR
jgi:hypothetical protein